eukprot:TRINITY_DN689_c1_g1_i2.p1 TRINITY_DN689_c1_g1~~TRINITY_DN689_c1_g1_i2.p1  ORF type:complete len:290 (-),score=56.13 TRINITY_DN689_c1_g1_i2:55-924(-)
MVRSLACVRLVPDGELCFRGCTAPAAASGDAGASDKVAAEGKVARPLTLSNVSDAPVAWKVRTNAPEAFLVCPRSGVLRPGESVEASVTLLLRGPDGAAAELPARARFEVRAFAAEAGQCLETVSREDWSQWGRSRHEVGYVSAVLRDGAAAWLEGRSRGEGGDETEAAWGGDDRRQQPSEERRPRRVRESWGGEAPEGWRFEGDAPLLPRSRGANKQVVPPAIARPAASDARDLQSPAPSPAAAKSGQMGPLTKVVLGVLISVLAFNLYLKPLVTAFLGNSGEEPKSS